MYYKSPISDDPARAATGHDWNYWFRLLDKSKAESNTHKQIARFLDGEHHLGGWWSQTVTGQYKKAGGRRSMTGQQCDSDQFDASVQRTVNAPVKTACEAFVASGWLWQWLGSVASMDCTKAARSDFRDCARTHCESLKETSGYGWDSRVAEQSAAHSNGRSAPGAWQVCGACVPRETGFRVGLQTLDGPLEALKSQLT